MGWGPTSAWQRSGEPVREPGGGKFRFGIQMFVALSPLLEET